MDWPLIYGLATGLVLLTALVSENVGLQKLALLLLMAWASTNGVITVFGFDHASLLNPTIDALVAISVAVVGYKHRLKAAIYVFALYLCVAAIHVGAFVLRETSSYSYYAALNIVFLAQLGCVGAPGAWLAVRRRVVARRERARAHPARG